MSAALRWKPSKQTRRLLRLGHIAAAGTWLGFDLILFILTVTALRAEATHSAAAAVSISAFTTWPLIVTGLVTLATGILLGTGSKYGLTRYWWVLIKLLLTIVLIGLVPVLLLSGVEALESSGLRALDTGGAPVVDRTALFPPIVSSASVSFAMVLSVFRPWGRVARRATLDHMPAPGTSDDRRARSQ
ncbi:hypothetical protein [Brevibacterium sediminis]|uniref:hypothetical protein n=1 Tax=Brevibacterium sediminis TaxID=1857024 RepID=UPI0015D5B391|nr:hypothetical protein [Brevibacterium sediminis]